MKSKLFCLVALSVSCGWLGLTPVMATEPLSVTSPDGNIKLTFQLKSNPQPYAPGERAYYTIAYKREVILTDSPLGLDFKGAPALDRDFEIVGSNRDSHDATWQNPLGTKRDIRDHFNEITVSLREKSALHRRLDIIFRAYDEGVAFRYILPKQETIDRFVLSSENTGFCFARDVSAYAIDLGVYTSPYETPFQRIPLRAIKPTSIIGLPLLVEVPQGPWVAILEADLRAYAGMYLGAMSNMPNALTSKLSPMPDFDPSNMGTYIDTVVTEHDLDSGFRKGKEAILISPERGDLLRSDEIVVARTPKATPWRVIMMDPRAGGLIENNNIILNLSAPSVLTDTSWIQPGKAAWNWWSGTLARNVNFEPGMNTATMKHYIDFAAEHHFEYMLIDGGWSPFNNIMKTIPEIDMPEIMAHARQRGVKVLLWVLWTEVRKHAEEAFALYEEWGVAGVKIDFMNRDDQEMVSLYEEMLRKAAAHHLTVDFHGAFKPTGLRRAYPNLLNREGVIGMEYDKANTRANPEHDVTIPFTRMLAGPMDYTPGCFHNVTRAEFKPRAIEPMCQGTRAHQLAMYVVFDMPLAMVSDFPEMYEDVPATEFLEKVPTVWDDTKVLNGEPARYVSIARRKGDTWYLGSMTNWDPRDLELPLEFLGPGEDEAKIFADGPGADKDATRVSIDTKRVKSSGHLKIHLAPGGGWAAIIRPLK